MESKIKLEEIIEKSKLAGTDKKEFINYLDTLTDDNLKRMLEMFDGNQKGLASFWLSLRAKMVLLQSIENSKKILEAEKEKIKKNIISMNEEEFYACVHTMKAEANTDPLILDKKIKKLLKAEEDSHAKFMDMASILSIELLKKQKETKRKESTQKYNELLKKIKG